MAAPVRSYAALDKGLKLGGTGVTQDAGKTHRPARCGRTAASAGLNSAPLPEPIGGAAWPPVARWAATL